MAAVEIWKEASKAFTAKATKGLRRSREKGFKRTKRNHFVKIPEGPICVPQEETVFAEVELKNEKYPGYKGCSIKSCFKGRADQVLTAVNVPIDTKDESMASIKVSIPLKLTENVTLFEEDIDADFSLTGPKGGTFGEPIQLKLKMLKKDDVKIKNDHFVTQMQV